MKKLDDKIERNLQYWKLLNEFQALLAEKLPEHPLSKSEQDPRRKLLRVDYFSSILFIMLNPVLDSMRGFCAISDLEKITQPRPARLVLGVFPKLNMYSIPKSWKESSVSYRNEWIWASAIPDCANFPKRLRLLMELYFELCRG